MKKLSYSLPVLFFIPALLMAQSASNNVPRSAAKWTSKTFFSPRFIENKGQFNGKNLLPDSKIFYGVDIEGYQIYFNPNGLTYRFDELVGKDKNHDGKKDENWWEKSGYRTHVENKGEGEKDDNLIYSAYTLDMKWLNANPNTEIIASEVVTEVFHYMDKEDAVNKSIYNAKAYKKLLYKNLYPDIDAEYIFYASPSRSALAEQGKNQKIGIKYTLILRPGADLSAVKMQYTGMDDISQDYLGNIHFSTPYGNIIDHSPVTFYEGHSGNIIPSSFKMNGNIVTFKVKNYDRKKTFIIDPWTTVPAQFTANLRAYEIDKDAAGNVYVFGGNLNHKLSKYTSAGVLLWTLSSTFDNGHGDLAVDPAGNSYITEGCSTTGPKKVNTSGVVTWSGAGGYEYWKLAFNCSYTKLALGGRGGSGQLSLMNLNNGALFNTTATSPSEIRAMVWAPNCKLYGLTMDLVNPTINQVICRDSNFAAVFAVPSTDNQDYAGPAYKSGGICCCSAVNSITADLNFIYHTEGTTLFKRNISTGAPLGSTIIPGGVFINNSGLDVDNCGNVYVGSQNGVYKFDSNLAQVGAPAALPGAVYDLILGSGGEVLACGSGFVAAVDMTACNAVACSCCPVINVAFNNINASCTGSGTSVATASGGSTPYTYLWSNGQIGQTATGLAAGNYSVTVSSSNGCSSSATTTITNTSGMSSSISSSSNVSCAGGNSGSATASVSGGNGPYTFIWNTTPVQNTITATGLSVGNYIVNVIDNNGCQATANVTITEPFPVAAGIIASVNPSCYGSSNGSATAFANGGTPGNGYAYQWNTSPPQNSASATGLNAGTYLVTATDSLGCTATASVTLTQPAAMAVTINTTTTNCGSSNGTATANVNSGGVSPYTYVWSNNQTAQTATGLNAGNYIVTVTDANGCTQTQTGTVTNSNGPVTIMSQTNILCNGQCTGGAIASVNNGTPPYTYLWSSGQNASSVNNFCAGNYTLVVSDATGCTDVQTVNITEPPVLSLNVNSTQANCGSSNGSATANVSGGTSPYTYLWSNGGTASQISQLTAQIYSVTVTDANNCTQTQTVSVAGTSGISASTSHVNVLCFGQCTGSATANVSAGTSPYTFLWTNSQTTSAANNLCAGSYTVFISDASGCTDMQTVSITQPSSAFSASASGGATIVIGDSVQLSASGGTSYIWTPSAGLSNPNTASPVATPVETTDYCVTATDANGCTDSACVRVMVDVTCGSVYVPNAFSPNGDSENDLECVVGNCIATMTFSIFNRWGEKVFETSDRKVCWDGKFRGNLQNAGVYTYILEAKLVSGEAIKKQGNISLIR